MKLTPTEMLNQVRSKVNLESESFMSPVVKLNKEGKIKFQLVALNSDNLFMPRTQHFIPKVPNTDDPKQKMIVCNCLGENCPVCAASNSFRTSGVKLDDVNDEYAPKYPYRNLRSVFTQPEHFLLGANILLDSPDEGTYLPKDSSVGDTQIIQFSRSALNSLMQAYEDYIEDNDDIENEENVPSLFAIFEDGDKTAKSFIINCRIQTSPYSYTFTFGKVGEVSIESINKDKLKVLSELDTPTEEYVQSAVKRIKDITNYFVSNPVGGDDDDTLPWVEKDKNITNKNESVDDLDDFDLDDLDTL